VAVEAALAEFGAWRRDADRKIAKLESELTELRGIRALHTGPPTLDLSSMTPAASTVAPMKEAFVPWTPAAAAAPAASPAPVAVPAAVVPSAPPSAPAVAPDVTSVLAPAVRVGSPVHYELEFRPGERVDLPDGLDGSRRKRLLGWLVSTFIVGGLAALVIAALASQR
jgi:hypothetical protein